MVDPIPTANASTCSSSALPQTWPQTLSSGSAVDVYLPTLRRPFRLSLPRSYGAENASSFPLLLYFHGWGGKLTESDPFHEHGIANDYIVAAPLGFDDEGTQYTSWNGGGTSGSHNQHRCHDPTGRFASLCYSRSCGVCNDTCSWTTCEDSVAQVSRLLAELKTALCIDPRRVFATGVSNGGVFLYELAASHLATAFAAYMPIVGSPQRGFEPPQLPVGGPAPFFGIWGRLDTTIPPIANPAARGHPGDKDVALDTQWGGYFFKTADAVLATWAATNGCAGASESLLLDAESNGTSITARLGCENSSVACKIAEGALSGWGASCKGWPSSLCDDGAAVIQCVHPHGHTMPPWAPAALYAFMQEHPGRIVPASPEGISAAGEAALMSGAQQWLRDHVTPQGSSPLASGPLMGVAAVIAVALLCGCALSRLRRRRKRNGGARGQVQLPPELSLPSTTSSTPMGGMS
jgi:poly(3-hydroxybutyrate) depolymerase